MLSLQISLLFILIHYSFSHDNHFGLPKRRFIALWSSPTDECKSKWNISIEVEKYGIVANYDRKRHGEHVNIFDARYGLWPRFDNDTRQIINGGIPQQSNLTAHLSKMADDIEKVLPDKDYQGMAVIDNEAWRPIYERRWNDMNMYRAKSEEVVRKEYSSMNDTQVYFEAKRQFEATAKDYMFQTIQLGKHLRPKALWGFYGFPEIFIRNGNGFQYGDLVKAQSDDLIGLFNASSVILPSVYLNQKRGAGAVSDFVQGNILEATRLRAQIDNGALPVFPSISLLYEDSANFTTETDMYDTVTQSAERGASGVIIWAASPDITESFCHDLQSYVDGFFGQYFNLLSSIAEDCSRRYCSSNGRCQFKMSHLKQFEMSDFLDMSNQWSFLRCNCDRGWEGKDCREPK